MKRLLTAIALSTCLATCLPATAQAPFFQLRDLDNNWQTYDDVKGDKLTVIDFWATWCQPCLRSIPELNTIYSDYHDRGVNIVGISVDGPRNQAKLKPFVRSMEVGYLVLHDINSEVMSDMNVTTVPTLLIFDREGKLVFLHEGYRPGDGAVIRKKLDELL